MPPCPGAPPERDSAITEIVEPERESYFRLLRTPGAQLICAISMTAMMSGSVVSPVLPVIQQTFAVPTASIGLVMTIFSLPGLLFAPVIALAADRYGRRAVIVPMLLLYGIAGSLTSLAWNFETLLIMRFLAGFGSSSVSFLSITLVGDLFERRQRAAVLGYRIAAGQSANLFLPLLAGALVALGWQFPFLLFGLAVPVGIFALFILEPEESKPSQSLAAYTRGVVRAIATARLAGLLTCAPTLMIVGQGAVATYLPIYMASKLGASPLLIGIVLSARVAAGISVSLMMGWLAERFGGERLTFASVLLLAVGCLWVPFAGSVWELLIPAAIFGVATGTGFPAFQTLLVNEAPDNMLAAVTAANGMTNRFGQTVGPLLGGLMFALGGLHMVFFGAVAFLAVMAVFYLAIFRGRMW